MHHPWLTTAQRIQALAQAGLTYCQNDYDRERYEELMQISAQMLADYSEAPFEKVMDLFERENGYLTPKVDIRGVVFRDDKLLMVQEKIDQGWTVPGGWADVGYSPSEIVVKEVQEEAGITVVPERLLAVLDKKCHDHPPTPFYTYKIFILCQHTKGEIQTGPETMNVGFFGENELPSLSVERLTVNQAKLLFNFHRNPDQAVLLD
ncbi:NUDIX hydrolase [Tunicatimonas pelagia]|uniref:NUDIX hydrolase n=1 Tax=Tunicatimonas pelagia TaxID=931531 RepID=UPI0026669A1A|nr:NUDIX hydrolase [Tunicatimonas pelagia]WKN45072.1 NUDIX hydrolase [Tunicatimonas pelagia]